MTPEENLARITEEVNQQLRQFGYILPETNQRLLEAQTGIKNFGFGVDVATKTLGGLADAVGDYTRAMYRGERGASVFNSSINKMADAAQTVAVGLSLLTPGGVVMKGLVAGLTFLTTQFLKNSAELTNTANQQADQMYDAFSQLAESGAVGADGIEGMFEDIQKLGLNVTKLDKFLALAGQNADQLALMGGTVAKGRRQFAELGLSMAQYETSFLKLGMDQDAQAEATLQYAKMQNRLSMGQIKDFGALSTSANKYILEQDALTKVTGLSRKQQQEALDEAMRNQVFAATIDDLIAKGKTEEARQLQVGLIAARSAGAQTAKGYQDLVSGLVQTQEARQLLLVSQGQAMKSIDDIKGGLFKDAPEAFNQSIQGVFEKMGETATKGRGLAMTGTFDRVMGPYTEATNAGMIATKNFAETMRLADEEQKKQLTNTGTALSNQAELRKAQNDTMLTFQAFVETGIPNLAKNTMQAVAKEFNELVVDLRKQLGSGPVVGTETRRPLGPQGILGTPTKSAILETNAGIVNPNGTVSRTGPVTATNPPVQRQPETMAPWSRTDPVPVEVVKPDSLITPSPEQKQPPAGGPKYGPLIEPPAKYSRAHGTSGEIGSLFEPKDIMAMLHQGERVLSSRENQDLNSLFTMVSQQQDLLSKKSSPIGSMIKTIESITQQLRSQTQPAAAQTPTQTATEMPNVESVVQQLNQGQTELAAMINSMKSGNLPQPINMPVMGDLPKLEIDREAAAQISDNIKSGFGDDLRTAVSALNKMAEQLSARNDSGLQAQMVSLLEDIRRAQSATAKASERMAVVAAN